MKEEEYNRQIAEATKFILDSVDESKDYKNSADLYKKANDKTIEIIKESIPKQIPAVISEESLTKIFEKAEAGAQQGVTSSKCQMPSTQGLADKIAALVLEKVSDAMDETIAKAVKRHSTQIEVRHEHYHTHTNMYGRFASSERNRKTMCWLGFITFVSLILLALFICGIYTTINLDIQIVVYCSAITIVMAIIGFIIRVNSKED